MPTRLLSLSQLTLTTTTFPSGSIPSTMHSRAQPRSRRQETGYKRALHSRASEGIASGLDRNNDIATESENSDVSSEEEEPNTTNMDIDNEVVDKMDDSRMSVKLDDVLSKDTEHYDTDMEEDSALLPTQLKPTFDSSNTREESKISEKDHYSTSQRRLHGDRGRSQSSSRRRRSRSRGGRLKKDHQRRQQHDSEEDELKETEPTDEDDDRDGRDRGSLSSRAGRRSKQKDLRRRHEGSHSDEMEEDVKGDSEDVSMDEDNGGSDHSKSPVRSKKKKKRNQTKKKKSGSKGGRTGKRSAPAAPRVYDRLNSPPKQLRIRWRRLMNVQYDGEWGFVEEIDKRKGKVLFVRRYRDSSNNNHWRRFEKWVRMTSKRLVIPDRRQPRPSAK